MAYTIGITKMRMLEYNIEAGLCHRSSDTVWEVKS